MTGEYDDIINLPRHVSKTRPQMPLIDRAAQFSPFAALTGHDSAIQETARLTDDRVELDEYIKNALNDKLQVLINWLEGKPAVKIRYFKPDENKEGGYYITANGTIKKIDEYEQIIIMDDGTVIPIDEIISIESKIFDKMYDERIVKTGICK
jgi:hypothetical protein